MGFLFSCAYKILLSKRYRFVFFYHFSFSEEPDESGLDVQFLMEVVVFGMQQFLECCWPTATLQSCKVHPAGTAQ